MLKTNISTWIKFRDPSLVFSSDSHPNIFKEMPKRKKKERERKKKKRKKRRKTKRHLIKYKNCWREERRGGWMGRY